MINYESNFTPSSKAERILRTGRIIGPEETPADMVSRIVNTLGAQEAEFTTPKQGMSFADKLGSALDAKEIVMSTPIMTNAGKYLEKPLTACAVPTSRITIDNLPQLQQEVITLHQQGMGTGFNLDDTEDPVKMLGLLNEIAVESANSGQEDRPVGNIAVLSVRHPKILDFISSKLSGASDMDWKFNISINIDDEFMKQVEQNGSITLWNGKTISSKDIFNRLCSAAATCADPGIVFLDRMNQRNPLLGMGRYKTTAPCAEVGLINGETCQFGYINLGKFIRLRKDGQPQVNYKKLNDITTLMTRALDNSIQVSQNNFNSLHNKFVSTQKRKMGIGLCGVADALSIVGIPYDSSEARVLMQDILSFINFTSKEASVRLAQQRGSFDAMRSVIGNRYLDNPSHIEQLYGGKDTNTVRANDWKSLAKHIRQSHNLRNAATIALPPTGRSALVVDASTGIEPHFNTMAANKDVLASLDKAIRQRYNVEIKQTQTHPPEVREILASAPHIHPLGHIAMVAAMQEYTDEAIAKTINLPRGASSREVQKAYLEGYRAGLSGVTVYVDGTHKMQPKEVK